MSKRDAHKNHPDGPCPVMRECGGCEWLGLPYRKQLARKQAAMEELFGPLIARMGWDVAVEPVLGMGARAGEPGKVPAPRGFRHKAATPFAPGPHGKVRRGFFARGTHRIIEVPGCCVEAPGAREILNEVGHAAEELGIPAYDEDTRRGLLRYAIVRMGWRTSEAMLTLVTAHRDVPGIAELATHMQAFDPRIVTVAQNVNPRVTNAILGTETHVLAGPGTMHDQLLGCTFEISPTAFYQTNPEQTEALYQLAIDGMNLCEGDVLLDAYCGSGTIGLAAARETAEAVGRAREVASGASACRQHGAEDDGGSDWRGPVAGTGSNRLTGSERPTGHACPIRLIGVERNPAGIADARRNAQLNGLEAAAEFIAQDATAYMERAAERGERVDVLSMDPPRAGSTPEFLAAAAALAPRRIVYISCNPVTQVRDLEQLGRAGYRLCRLTPVDMFPHTTHTETVAVLERG